MPTNHGSLIIAGRYTFLFLDFEIKTFPNPNSGQYAAITLQITSNTFYHGMRLVKNISPEQVIPFARHFGITPVIGQDSPAILLARCKNLEADLNIVHKILNGKNIAGIDF